MTAKHSGLKERPRLDQGNASNVSNASNANNNPMSTTNWDSDGDGEWDMLDEGVAMEEGLSEHAMGHVLRELACDDDSSSDSGSADTAGWPPLPTATHLRGQLLATWAAALECVFGAPLHTVAVPLTMGAVMHAYRCRALTVHPDRCPAPPTVPPPPGLIERLGTVMLSSCARRDSPSPSDDDADAAAAVDAHSAATARMVRLNECMATVSQMADVELQMIHAWAVRQHDGTAAAEDAEAAAVLRRDAEFWADTLAPFTPEQIIARMTAEFNSMLARTPVTAEKKNV
jgi:hypothetical protein